MSNKAERDNSLREALDVNIAELHRADAIIGDLRANLKTGGQ